MAENDNKGNGFWDAWNAGKDEAGEEGPRRGRGRGKQGRRRGERGEQWRQHFNNYMGAYPEDHWLFSGRRFRPWHGGRPGFNPFVANLMSMGGGLLPVLVLQLIADEPRYGNELMTLIREKTAGQWVANPGAIYPLLTQMEEEALISGRWEDDVKRTTRIYEITPKGKGELRRLTEIVKPKLAEAIGVLQEIENGLNGTPREGE